MSAYEIKSWNSTDYLPPGESFYDQDGRLLRQGPTLPEDLTNCAVSFDINVGPINTDRSDIFYFTVMTPAYLKNALDKEKLIFGKSLILVNAFSWEEVQNRLDKLVKSLSDENEDALLKLSRYGQWEFEDYRSE